ncbi:glycosyltransferase family 4 protein [Vibrio kasasachensis]|uniref:glycosyltransferase family 4 protein n=1 Tax=Vibrio kasasachensis TaxID=2910248 RepID=UPI003D0A81F4
MKAAGYDVSFIVPHERDESLAGVKIYAIARNMSKFSRLFVQPVRLLRKAMKVEVDLYHFHDFELWPIAVVLRFMGYKVIADVHEDVPAQLRQRKWIPRLLKPLLSSSSAFIENNLSRFMTGIVVADKNLEKRFARYNKNVVTLNNYPLLFELPARRYNEQFRVVSVGGVFDERCADLIIEAAKDLKDVSFAIGGGVVGTYQGLEWQTDNCKYLGRLSFEQVQQEYSDADLIIVMFSNADNHRDIKSNRFFESMYAAKPVLVSNMPNWVEFINQYKCGLAVDLNLPHALADSIDKLRVDRVLAGEMGEKGRAAVLSSFSWSSEETKLLAFYSDIKMTLK